MQSLLHRTWRWAIAMMALPWLLGAPAMGAYVFTPLDEPPGGSAYGISGNTIVGGFYDASLVQHGFSSNGSTYARLDAPSAGTLREQGTTAYGVAGNIIVGSYIGTDGVTFGFLYNGSTYMPLNYPVTGSRGNPGTWAFGVSANTVVGAYTDTNDDYHGFLYNGATYTSLDDPWQEGFGTWATGISDNTVVGYYNGENRYHGFIYKDGVYTTLDDPLAGAQYGAITDANGISGNIVIGDYVTAPSKLFHGFIYDGVTYTTLDDPLGAGGTFLNGISGNTVVGTYNDSAGFVHSFSVTIPEPGSFSLAVLGSLLLLSRRIRLQ